MNVQNEAEQKVNSIIATYNEIKSNRERNKLIRVEKQSQKSKKIKLYDSKVDERIGLVREYWIPLLEKIKDETKNPNFWIALRENWKSLDNTERNYYRGHWELFEIPHVMISYIGENEYKSFFHVRQKGFSLHVSGDITDDDEDGDEVLTLNRLKKYNLCDVVRRYYKFRKEKEFSLDFGFDVKKAINYVSLFLADKLFYGYSEDMVINMPLIELTDEVRNQVEQAAINYKSHLERLANGINEICSREKEDMEEDDY